MIRRAESTEEDPIYTCTMDEDTASPAASLGRVHGPACCVPSQAAWLSGPAHGRGARRLGPQMRAGAFTWAPAGDWRRGDSRGQAPCERLERDVEMLWQISNPYPVIGSAASRSSMPEEGSGRRKRLGGHAPRAFTCHLAQPATSRRPTWGFGIPSCSFFSLSFLRILKCNSITGNSVVL